MKCSQNCMKQLVKYSTLVVNTGSWHLMVQVPVMLPKSACLVGPSHLKNIIFAWH